MMPIEISNCCQCESQVSGQSAKNSASDKPDPLIMFILFLIAADDFLKPIQKKSIDKETASLFTINLISTYNSTCHAIFSFWLAFFHFKTIKSLDFGLAHVRSS